MNRTLSLVAGLFSILNTVQFLIFELNHVAYFGYEDRVDVYTDAKSMIVSWVMIHKRGISIVLSATTILLSVLLLCCVHMNNYVGLVCYALWIVAYESLSFSMVMFVNGTIEDHFKELKYLNLIFQISRMLLHFFSLPFITKHTYVLYKDPKISVKAGRRRRSSVGTVNTLPPVRLGTLYHKSN